MLPIPPLNKRLKLAARVDYGMHLSSARRDLGAIRSTARPTFGHSARMKRFLTVLASALVLGCALRPPRLTTRALGCYDVHVQGWSNAAAKVTGFAALPSTLALDSVFVVEGGRRVVVTADWLVQGANRNHTTWGNTLGDWQRLGDSLIFLRSNTGFHELAADSIVVSWSGWGGSLTAYLAPTAFGYSGLAQLQPRPLAKGLPPIFVKLDRRVCS